MQGTVIEFSPNFASFVFFTKFSDPSKTILFQFAW